MVCLRLSAGAFVMSYFFMLPLDGDNLLTQFVINSAHSNLINKHLLWCMARGGRVSIFESCMADPLRNPSLNHVSRILFEIPLKEVSFDLINLLQTVTRALVLR